MLYRGSYINKLLCKSGFLQNTLSNWNPPQIGLNGWGKWEQFHTGPSGTWSKSLLKQSEPETLHNYLHSLINTVRVLADPLQQRQSVHDFLSKTIIRYSFQRSSEPTSTLFPLHPRMNPKMANVQHRDTRMLVNLPYIIDNRKMRARSVQLAAQTHESRDHPWPF